MQFHRATVDTPHPGNIPLDFKIVLDATDPKQITLNGSDVSDWLNSWPGGFDFSEPIAATQPSKGTNEITWEDQVTLQHLDAGSDYLFFDAADTNGMCIFALAKSARTAGSPRIIDFGNTTTQAYGLYYRSDAVCAYTPTSHGGAITDADPLASSTDYRSIGFVVEFGSIQRVFIDNAQVASDPITLLDLRDAYIANTSTRQLNSGPMVIGLTSKVASQDARNFRDGSMKSILVAAGIPSSYERELIQKYHDAKEAA